MSDHIDDKELEELNEIYRRKMESQKSHEPKKAKHEKPVRAAKSEDTHSVKATKGKKISESTKQIRVKPEKQDNEDKVQPESSSDSERKKKLAVRINIGVCTAFFAAVAIGLLVLPRPTISEAEKRNLATFP